MTLLAALPFVGSPPLVPLEMTIDRDHLAQMTLGEDELAREVLTLFDAQADQTLAELRDPEADTSRLAHRLRGAARGVGAFAVAEAADELERARGRSGRAEALRILSEAIRQTRLEIAEILRLS